MVRHAYAIALAFGVSTAIGAQAVEPQRPAEAPPAAGTLSDADVESAIALGKAKRNDFGVRLGTLSALGAFGCSDHPNTDGCGFGVFVSGAYGRVAFRAAENAKKYLKFTADSVPADVRVPALFVDASPTKPSFSGGSWRYAPDAKHVVIQAKAMRGGDDAIQPVRVETYTVEWGNAMGGKFSGQGVRAWFDPAAIPPGDIDIVVITDAKEQRYAMTAKFREKNADKLR